MSTHNTPLFVRLPKQQVAALERLSEKTGRPKQHLLSEWLAERLMPRTLAVGRIDVTDGPDLTSDAVLTLEEAAALFKLPVEAIRSAAEDGDLPGRRFAAEWRFSRMALLTWLSQGERSRNRRGRGTL
jgi:excisionase family DNA binding protein